MAMQHIARQAERAGKVIKSVHDFVRRRDQAREAVQAQQLLDAILPLVSLQARKLGVRVKGLSFHVGSQVADPGRYVEAIDTCRELMLHSAERGLARLEVLDIGGGFPIPGPTGPRAWFLAIASGSIPGSISPLTVRLRHSRRTFWRTVQDMMPMLP